MSEDYSGLKGYEADADLGVGCGLPTEYAGIKEGNTDVYKRQTGPHQSA